MSYYHKLGVDFVEEDKLLVSDEQGLKVYQVPSLKVEGPLSIAEELFRRDSVPSEDILGLSRVHMGCSKCRRLMMCTESGVSEIVFDSDGSAVVRPLLTFPSLSHDAEFYAPENIVGSSKVIGIRFSSIVIYQVPVAQSNPIRCEAPLGGKWYLSALMDETAGRIVLYDRDEEIVYILDYP